MTTPLKDGSTASDSRLGRIYEPDLRSLNFLVRTQIEPENVKKPRSYTWYCPIYLDQGPDGACVGFGYSHEAAARPQSVMGINYAFAMNLYYQTQREDPWPGGAYPGAEEFYEGTSVLTGAKVMRSRGYYSGYTWALDAREIAQGIGYTGPCVLGLDWYEGMFETNSDGFIRPTGGLAGGHCVLAKGVKIVYKPWRNLYFWRTRTWADVDFDKSYVIIHNSWGPNWGNLGAARLSLSDLDLLMGSYGEACFPKRTTKTS